MALSYHFVTVTCIIVTTLQQSNHPYIKSKKVCQKKTSEKYPAELNAFNKKKIIIAIQRITKLLFEMMVSKKFNLCNGCVTIFVSESIPITTNYVF